MQNITSILATIEAGRLAKAAQALATGTYEVTVTRVEEGYVAGYVVNGNSYGVTLADGMATCSCPDSMYRHQACKHQALLALHILRAPQPEQKEETAPDLSLRKMRRAA